MMGNEDLAKSELNLGQGQRLCSENIVDPSDLYRKSPRLVFVDLWELGR